MATIESKIGIFKLRNYFAVVGLGSTIVAAILLVLLYRHMAISDIVTLGERNNLMLAKTVLSSVKTELVDYLADKDHPDNPGSLPPPLSRAIQNIMTNSSVLKIVIFNRNGTVVFSTQPSLIGIDQGDYIHFRAAIDGKITSRLIYNDSFSIFKNANDDDNLVQSYLPVRANPISPIYGVFEIYTDVQTVVDRVERTEAIAFFGVFVVLLMLYSFLLMIVRASANTIGNQQSIINERTRTLELLSSQMLNAHETEKKSLASKLHEDVAQNLAAVKNNIEISYAKLQKSLPASELSSLQKNIHSLQQAIQDVRALTMELRPPSLDDFGLLETIDGLCREYDKLYPDVAIKVTSDIDESSMPGTLKTLIYRITQETLTTITRIGEADKINIDLGSTADTVYLSIENNALPYHANEVISIENATNSAFASMKERTLLSGGTFTIEGTSGGGTHAKASWHY